MNKMCRVLFMLLVSSSMAISGVLAEEKQDSVAINEIVASMKQLLKLTEPQVRAVTSVLSEQFKRIQDVRAQHLSPDLSQQRIKSIQKDQESQLSNYLSDEQLTQWKSVMSQALQQGIRSPKGNTVASSGKLDKSPKNFMPQEGPAATNDSGVLQSGVSRSAKGGIY